MLSLLFPDRCPLCEAIGAAPCAECASHLPPAPQLYAPALIDEIHSLTAYADSAMTMVRALKYSNRRGCISWAADQLSDRVIDNIYDCVTWMPSSASGKRRRGYEPSRLLAEALAKRIDVPARALLLRKHSDGGQTKQGRHGRLEGPNLRLRRSLPGRRILLVDDVSTTGASLTAAASVLRGAGATGVEAAVIARTP